MLDLTLKVFSCMTSNMSHTFLKHLFPCLDVYIQGISRKKKKDISKESSSVKETDRAAWVFPHVGMKAFERSV